MYDYDFSFRRVVGYKGKFNKGRWKSYGKIIDTHLKRGADKMDFLQEAATLSHLKHPNIVTFYGIVVDGAQVRPCGEVIGTVMHNYVCIL